MTDSARLAQALTELAGNPEQLQAAGETHHCVVLAGPGSGKTKTLTTAIARTLIEDVAEPQGIACITYNNECAVELETRLAKLGVEPGSRAFIGTVHSFALSQVVMPYARCVLPEIGATVRIATEDERKAAVETAHAATIGRNEDPHGRWKFAEEKRRTQVDRSLAEWRGTNEELANFVEGYEAELRRQGLIDFDDMPLLALRIVRENEWVQRALVAKFPVLFVDEYQDLGHALHQLVLLLCFQGGMRLFAVGDADQSMYGFLGASPELLQSLSERDDVNAIQLRFNYRCGSSIIEASLGALGEDRDYQGPEGGAVGTVDFHGVKGDLDAQAAYVINDLIPRILESGIALDEIAVLYRNVKQADVLARAAFAAGIPVVRADNNALIKRNSKLARFVEACAAWQCDGWRSAEPPFRRLVREAAALVYGPGPSREEVLQLESELMGFLNPRIGVNPDAHQWLSSFRTDLINSWRPRSRNLLEDWTSLDTMVARTDPAKGEAITLANLAGRVEGTGRLNMSTLHSAKGREWDAVIMFAMNNDVIPNYYEGKTASGVREARRQFYVGVTRPRSQLHIVYSKGGHSPFVREVHQRLNAD